MKYLYINKKKGLRAGVASIGDIIKSGWASVKISWYPILSVGWDKG